MLMKQRLYLSLILLATLVACNSRHSAQPSQYHYNKGNVFHTLYSITYQHTADLHDEIKAELQKFDASLSMFNAQSILSRVNNNDPDVKLDPWFIQVFNQGMKISQETQGAFDMTVAPLVNAWGFGFKKSDQVTPMLIDSIKEFVGYQKVRLHQNKIEKDDPRILLDASAIAKGFSCDVIAQLFDRKGVENYMIEIGGEVVTKGVNPKNTPWNIGISKPVEDSIPSNELAAILSLQDVALATSGNYRNFYYKDGKKYAHTIDPSTGYPVEHSLLSVTVLAPHCMLADALATSFMVMGLERSLQFLQTHSEVQAYFIYAGEDGKNQITYSDGMNKYIKQIIND